MSTLHNTVHMENDKQVLKATGLWAWWYMPLTPAISQEAKACSSFCILSQSGLYSKF